MASLPNTIGPYHRQSVISILNYFYEGRLDIKSDHCIETLLLSSRLGLFGLTETIYRYIIFKLKSETALDYLSQFIKITDFDINSCTQLKIIQERCLSIIDKYGISAILRPALYKCDSRILTWIVARDSLRINEWTLFTALLQWANNRCELTNTVLCMHSFRSLLGPVFDRIRFPLMKIPELVTVNRSGLALKRSEYELILSYLLDNPKPAIPFPITPRSPLGMVAERFKSSKMVMVTSYPQEVHQIDLIVDQQVRFIGIGIFTPNFHHLSIGKTLINLQLWYVAGSERIFSVTRRLIHGSLSHQSIYQIILSSCIHLLPKIRYSLIMILKHNNWRNNSKELTAISGVGGSNNIQVVVDERNTINWKIKNPRFHIQPYHNNINGSSIKKGQFHSFIFDCN
ncbi:BTB/POZ domain-containing protein 2-like [Tetranychus urticae]|uniref:PHR domain-containing protein n=1 Tax=Tetranychus urticae TaxID=32264 RepID=T1KXQ0_TETUR|nr:BTB/POZ domain-containing protein 2-like [Tetranychus urticae]